MLQAAKTQDVSKLLHLLPGFSELQHQSPRWLFIQRWPSYHSYEALDAWKCCLSVNVVSVPVCHILQHLIILCQNCPLAPPLSHCSSFSVFQESPQHFTATTMFFIADRLFYNSKETHCSFYLWCDRIWTCLREEALYKHVSQIEGFLWSHRNIGSF